MKARLLIAAGLFLSLLSPFALAQGCTYQTTKTVRAQLTLTGNQSCSGATFTVAGVAFSTPQSGCPLLGMIVPEHEIPETSAYETRIEKVGTVPCVAFDFLCKRDYFLFITINSSCVMNKRWNAGTVDRLKTVGC